MKENASTMNKNLQLIFLLLVAAMFTTVANAQNIRVQGGVTSLRLSDGSDCISSADPRIYARVSTTSTAWSGTWAFETDDVGTTTGSCSMTCNKGSCGNCGWTNVSDIDVTVSATENWWVQLNGYESDGVVCSGDDGNCGGFGDIYNAGIVANYAPNCAGGYTTGSNTRTCSSDGSTQTYTCGWRFRYYFTGLSDANAGGTISSSSALTLCAGSTIAFTGNTPLSGRQNAVNWQLNGSDISGAATIGSYTTPALSAGIYTYRRRLNYCTDFSSGTTNVYSNAICYAVFPAAPTITAPANTCNAAFTLPSVTAVSGFTVQYNIDNTGYTSSPTVPTTPGCHTVQARYVVTSACGSIAAGTTGPAGCVESNTVSVVIYPAAPTLTAPSNTCNTAFTLPSVTSVAGFNTEYSIDAGAYTTTPSIPTTPGCHTVKARYTLNATCGLTAAGTTAPSGCLESNTVSVVIFPATPTIVGPTSNTCNAALTAISAIPTVAGFNSEYSVTQPNGTTSGYVTNIATANALLTNTTGCFTIKARYTLASNCGGTSSGAVGSGSCAEAVVNSVVFPASPTISGPTGNTCNAALPAMSPITAPYGFTTQYNVTKPDGSTSGWVTNPTTSNSYLTNTPGCFTLGARYVLSSACGSTASGTVGTGSCATTTVNYVVFPSAPTITALSNKCNTALDNITAITDLSASGFTDEYAVQKPGGALSAYGTLSAANALLDATPGCWTIKARYKLSSSCGGTAANSISASVSCQEGTTNAVVFPAAPVITAPSNTCQGTAFTLPTVSAVSGFTVQYSIDGGTYSTSPSIPSNTPGCHTIKARYILTSACGSTAASATAPGVCLESNTVSVTIFPTKPTLTATSNVCEGTPFTLPSVTSVSGFTVEYNIDGSGYSSSPTIPTTPGCHTVQARYVLSADCGSTLAGSTGLVSCLESNTVSIVTFPTAPTLTSPSNTCAGTPFTLPSVTSVSGFNIQYSIDGGAYSTLPSIPTTVGCHTVKARYVLNSSCGTTAANATAPGACLESAAVSVVIFPAAPTITATSNTCQGTAITLPSVTTVAGFTIQYNIDGGGYTSSPTAPSTPGCHTVQARYVLTSACGTNVSGTTGPAGCLESNTVSIAVFPTAPSLTPPSNVCEGTAFTLPSVTSVAGFDIEYSVDGGIYDPSPTIPTTPGCHTVRARYVISSTCGTTAAGATGPAGCAQSAVVSVVVFPTAPVITAPANTCAGTAFTLPSVPAVTGFTVQYSINSGTFSSSPSVPTTAGTYTVEAQYALTSACGTNASGATGSGTCGVSNTVSVTVYGLPALTDPTPASQTVCLYGAPTSISTSPSGGTPSAYTIQWYENTSNSTTGGTLMGTGTSIFSNTNSTGTKYYYAVVTQPESGCTAKTNTTASVTVVALPAPGTLTKSPNVTEVCDGANVSATATAGTGGTGTITDVLEYRTDNGSGFSAWIPYTSGSSISTTGLVAVEIQTYRTATGSGCTTSSVNTVSWSVNPQPIAGTLTKTPNTTNVCEGTNVSAALTAGSGGAGTITDVLEYRYNGTGAWSTYTSGNNLSTTGKTMVEIRTYRTATGSNCATSTINTVSWDVDPAPVATPAVDYISTCDGTAQLSYTVSNPGTFSWNKVSGTASPSTSSDNPLIVTGLVQGATAVYQLLGSLPGCTNINMGSVSLPLPTNSSTTIATTASCNYCVIQDGAARYFYNSSGELIAKVEDDVLVTPDKLDGTEVCVRINGSVQSILDNLGNLQPYLQRQWTIHPANNTSAHVTLYFTNSELGALQAAANSTYYQFSGYDLYVTKYPGGQGGVFTPPCTGGTPGCGQVTAENVPAAFSSYGSNHKVEFDVSTFSTFYVAPSLYPFSPLPVELISFTGWNQGSVNRLQWITASERNTARYEVQKSTTPGVWTTIGEKQAAGNSNNRLTYDFTDNSPAIGDNYYRLRIVDNDGSFSLTNMINIPISDAVANNFSHIYPNPTSGKLNVEIQSTSLYDTRVIVYDVLGKNVFEKPASLVKGLNTLQFDFGQLSKGTYIIQFADGEGKIHTSKFVKD